VRYATGRIYLKTYSYTKFSILTMYLDSRREEILMGFYVRAGTWIDGIEILTSFGRVYGDAKGGIW
jgi:hypothetical protein